MVYTVIATRGGNRTPDRDYQTFATVDEALNQACTHLSANIPWVAIVDGNGRVIKGDALRPCCLGERTLNDDLSIS